jgi:hypothetical protein
MRRRDEQREREDDVLDMDLYDEICSILPAQTTTMRGSKSQTSAGEL